mmetsp:Transcript_3286/g.10056  ORF Transcript_3286/g.10056 Transcript_3286/m.10056 type:complete len:171 (-) Transcript_3286:8-520(-)
MIGGHDGAAGAPPDRLKSRSPSLSSIIGIRKLVGDSEMARRRGTMLRRGGGCGTGGASPVARTRLRGLGALRPGTSSKHSRPSPGLTHGLCERQRVSGAGAELEDEGCAWASGMAAATGAGFGGGLPGNGGGHLTTAPRLLGRGGRSMAVNGFRCGGRYGSHMPEGGHGN